MAVETIPKRDEAWLAEIKTLSLFEIAETLLESYVLAESGMIAEYGKPKDFQELYAERAAYEERLTELKAES